MISIRCTRKLLDRLGRTAVAEEPPPPSNALGDWYANLLYVGRDQLVVATSEKSFLTVLLPARDLRKRLEPGLREMLAMLLAELDVPQTVIECELASMQPAVFARTASRSVLASMNELARHAQFGWQDGLDFMAIMRRLASLPLSALGDSKRGMGRSGERARQLLGLEGKRPPPARLVQLRVELLDLAPAVWRRILVADSINLPELHRVLQDAMGWTNSHLHEYEIGGARYGVSDPEFADERPLRDERGVRLLSALPQGGDRIFYIYDFGDDWRHEVRIEGVLDNAPSLRPPLCTEGANRCPPEDVGGAPGYMNFLEILANPADQEHAHTLAWAGGAFDPRAFDLDEVNQRLRWGAAMV